MNTKLYIFLQSTQALLFLYIKVWFKSTFFFFFFYIKVWFEIKFFSLLPERSDPNMIALTEATDIQ